MLCRPKASSLHLINIDHTCCYHLDLFNSSQKNCNTRFIKMQLPKLLCFLLGFFGGNTILKETTWDTNSSPLSQQSCSLIYLWAFPVDVGTNFFGCYKWNRLVKSARSNQKEIKENKMLL